MNLAKSHSPLGDRVPVQLCIVAPRELHLRPPPRPPPPGSYSDPDAFAGTVMDFHGGQTPVTVVVRNRPSGPMVFPGHLGLFNDPTGRPRLRFSATPGTLWRLEASDSLGAGGWTTLLTFVVGPDWRVDFGDPASLAQARKFYRAVSP